MQFDDTRIVSGSWDKTIKVGLEACSHTLILPIGMEQAY